jgi:MFS family permease
VSAVLTNLRRSFSGLPTAFWWLWLGTLINRVGIFVTPFLTLFLTGQRGLSIEASASIVALEGVGSFIAHLVGGTLADRIGRRMTMLISFFGAPVLMMALYYSQAVWVIALVAFLYGFFIDLYRPASSAMIADIVPATDRVRAYALRYWAINLGASVGLALAGFLATQDYILLFIGDALTTFVFGIIILFTIKESRPEAAKHAAKAKNGLSLRLDIPQHERQTFAFVIVFMLLSIAFGALFVQTNVTMPLAMKADGLTEADYGRVGALNGIVIVLVSLPLNHYLTRYSRFVVIAAATLLTGIGFGMFALANTVPIYALGVLIWTIGELTANPIGTTIIADVAPIERRGFYQGIYGASWGISGAVGPLVGGAVYQRFGGDTLWLLCFVVGILAAVGYLTVVRRMYERLMTKEKRAPLVIEGQPI